MRFGVAQRYLFRDQRVSPDGTTLTQRISDLLLFGSTSVVPHWNLSATVQYSPQLNRTVQSVLQANYSPSPFRVLSATYRLTRNLTEQVEVGWQWPLYGRTPDLSASAGIPRSGGAGCSGSLYTVGRVNYSTLESRIVGSIVGFEYDAGCWIARVVAERLSTGDTQATSRLLFQLELVGLSRLGSNPCRC